MTKENITNVISFHFCLPLRKVIYKRNGGKLIDFVFQPTRIIKTKRKKEINIVCRSENIMSNKWGDLHGGKKKFSNVKFHHKSSQLSPIHLFKRRISRLSLMQAPPKRITCSIIQHCSSCHLKNKAFSFLSHSNYPLPPFCRAPSTSIFHSLISTNYFDNKLF